MILSSRHAEFLHLRRHPDVTIHNIDLPSWHWLLILIRIRHRSIPIRLIRNHLMCLHQLLPLFVRDRIPKRTRHQSYLVDGGRLSKVVVLLLYHLIIVIIASPWVISFIWLRMESQLVICLLLRFHFSIQICMNFRTFSRSWLLEMLLMPYNCLSKALHSIH